MFVTWFRTDAATASAKMTYGEFSATTRGTLSSVPPVYMTSDSDDEPLKLSDRLKSPPADPIETPELEVHRAKRLYQTRCLFRCQ